MSDVYITDYSLQSCLGKNISEAVETLRLGAVEPATLLLPNDAQRPFHRMPFQPLLQDAWHDVRSATLYLASSSYDMYEIKTPDQLGSPLYAFGNALTGSSPTINKPFAINTACTSSFSAISMAMHRLGTQQSHHAIVLGVDLYNDYTFYGFEALQLLAPNQAEPLGQHRQGLVLGEAIASLHLSKSSHAVAGGKQKHVWRVLSCTHIVDGQNPTGATTSALVLACQQALQLAKLQTIDIDLIKLQAAGSPTNDELEVQALKQVFENLPPCVSLKMALGHTLGASGAAETALLLACIEQHVWPVVDYALDASLGVQLVSQAHPLPFENINTVLLVTLGFGGGHSVLILQKHREAAS
ncbi:MAG TPA: beta-ketoacyl synthase N-terminal-like domain-containing protein [Burkholderiaceae bacterium]|nr:beta-ketoacyl synthase N-terminal-like domain-containing protein [Burkholderiaceae bacterium]